jgi:signal transduction histidine kinase/CheY-like chemotaxis protein
MYRNTLYVSEGSAPLVLGHALDITDRIRIEHALKRAKSELRKVNDELAHLVEERTAELQEANRRLRAEIEQRRQMEEELVRRRNLESLGLLAGGIAHDFNNFLTVVQGNTALARLGIEAGRPLEGILDEIDEACERAARLSSQLLTFSKGGAPVRRVVSVTQLLLDAVQLARTGSALEIVVNISEDVWQAEIDPGQIGQVLKNILLNSQEAMPAGGAVEVAATNLVAKDPSPAFFVRITVRDYGSGIPPDVLPRIFDPYFTTKPRSNGLGLTSAYSIIQKHGGLITVDSQPGKGTLVTVDLPASQASVATHHPEVRSANGGPWKLLVMDDEDALRKLLKSILSSYGHEVTCACDGAEAIALYESAMRSGHRFDAVLLDLTVQGGMGGAEAAARLKDMDASAKLIVSSGYSDSPVLSDFRSYGFESMIPKPWTAAQLMDVFRNVLPSH